MINNFEEWLNELEGFSLRMERVYDDLVVNPKDTIDNWKQIKIWLKAAFDGGYEAGEINKQFLIQDLKNEIRTQRLEIAGLREERRGLVDKDFPPGYNRDF
jgi:hypothetical protein